MSSNVPGAGDVAPVFGAQCDEARGAQRQCAYPVLYAVASPHRKAAEARTAEVD
jgi:hypothetical protein